MPKRRRSIKTIVFVLICLSWAQGSRSQTQGVENGQKYGRLVIRNVMVIDGKGTPARGPEDIILSGNEIQSVVSARDAGNYREEAHVLDGTGMYLLPGLINLHGHVTKVPALPSEYRYKLYLASGVTSQRDVGSDYTVSLEDRSKSKEGRIVATRIFLYMSAREKTPEKMRQRVREIKELGGDGVKIFGLDRDVMEACLTEAKELGLRVAHHVGVEETDAWDDAAFGVTTIEHWYGIADAALHGSQNFPLWYNFDNEYHRFAYAGRLWREADPEVLKQVFRAMIDGGVSWDPTFVIYEGNRDLQRVMNQPWFEEYLHPILADYWIPTKGRHGCYFWKWTTADEVAWRENYRLWMEAVCNFAEMGGLVGVGDDAGYGYCLFGFSMIRELELHQEAGFHPIDVIQHATGNNAKILGMEDRLGRVRAGYLADLILVEQNPLENLKYLYPTGVLERESIDGTGKIVSRGGVKWTIKDGIVYHAPTLLEDVKRIVDEAKSSAGH